MYRQFYRKLFVLSAAALLATAASIQAAETTATTHRYTLDEAMNIATQNSPTLQKSEAYAEEMSWKNTEGLSAFLPKVDLSASHFLIKKYQYIDILFGGNPTSIPQIFPTTGATLGAQWLLFDGLANVNTYRATSHLKKAAAADFDWAKFSTAKEVKLAYSHVVAARKLQDVADQNLKTIQNHLDQVQKMKAGGISTNYDLLRVEAQLSESRAEMLQAEDNIQITQEKLGQVLGLEEAADAADTDLEVPTSDAVKKVTFSNEQNRRLDLQALEDKVYASDLKDSASGSFWVPKVSLAAQYIKYNNLSDGITDWNRYRDAWNAGVFLNWQIFAPADFARSKQDKYQFIQNEKSLRQANLAAPVDFAFWKRRYLYSATLYQAKKADLERATETVRLAEAGFKAGVRTTTDMLDAELELFRARAGIVTSQINCAEAKIKLELALGENI
jgi:outer membrane protein TolC